MNLKRILIILASIAVVLGLIAFYVVFYGNNGTYVINSTNTGTDTFSSSSTISLASSTASSTASATLASASSTASGTFSTSSVFPPISWQEGNEMMSVTGATLSGSQLTLQLQIVMGSVAECVPLNIRVVADENGDLTPPVTTQFAFPDSGTCEGTPGETYTDQQVVFSVNPTLLPLIVNTGGTSNMIFEINTSGSTGLTVELPPRSD